MISKPPFISTLDDRVEPTNILELARGSEPDPSVSPASDKDTSGVLAIARESGGLPAPEHAFEHREVTKIYHAVADGRHDFQDQLVDAPILKQNDGTARFPRR